MKLKKVLCIIALLLFLQIARIGFKSLLFIFIERTLFTDVLVNISYMLIIIIASIIIIKKKKLDINIFPTKFNIVYKILTILVTLFLITTPIITNNYEIYDILSLIYGAVITVIFEEMIFRGFVYKEISNSKNEIIAYIVSTILFGVWHLGYIDTIIWRTSIFSPNANIANIMLWKVITGLIIGVMLGFCRYKSKNTYSSMLLHAAINIFGS